MASFIVLFGHTVWYDYYRIIMRVNTFLCFLLHIDCIVAQVMKLVKYGRIEVCLMCARSTLEIYLRVRALADQKCVLHVFHVILLRMLDEFKRMSLHFSVLWTAQFASSPGHSQLFVVCTRFACEQRKAGSGPGYSVQGSLIWCLPH